MTRLRPSASGLQTEHLAAHAFGFASAREGRATGFALRAERGYSETGAGAGIIGRTCRGETK